jgi:hypothetical protein
MIYPALLLPPVYTVIQEQLCRRIRSRKRTHDVLESGLEIQQPVGTGDEVAYNPGLCGLPYIGRFLGVFRGMSESRYAFGPNGVQQSRFISIDIVFQPGEIYIVENRRISALHRRHELPRRRK